MLYSSVTFTGESGVGTMKLVEGQTIELEDGTMAYVQNTPKGKKNTKENVLLKINSIVQMFF